MVRADAVAGLTVALLLIPQSMAYAELAGLPPQVGLYAAFLPTLLGGLFGSCRQLATGPVAMTSILVASVLASHAQPMSEQYVILALLLSLMVGIIRIAMGMAKMAGLVNLLSHPALAGFTNAAAMIIGLSQLNRLLGLPRSHSRVFCGFLRDLLDLGRNYRDVHLPTLLFGVGAFVLIYTIRRFRPRWPAMLIAMVIGIVISRAIGFHAYFGGAVIGTIPAGLPRLGLSLPASVDGIALVEIIQDMLPGALAVTLIGFMETVSVSKAIALKTRQPINLNLELIGQGVASLGAGLSQGCPVSGSLSRSAVNLMSGARSGLSSVFTTLVVMATLLFATPLFYHLPSTVLAAGIVVAVFQLIDLKSIRHAWRVSKRDGFTALATWGATLLFAPAIERGVFVGVFLAMFFYLRRTMSPPLMVVGRSGDGTLRDARQLGLEVDEHLPSIRLDGSLYFGSVGNFEDSVLMAVREFPKATGLLIICEGINFIDASGEWCLRELWQRLKQMKIELYFAGLKQGPMDILQRSGLVDKIGRSHFVGSAQMALMALER